MKNIQTYTEFLNEGKTQLFDPNNLNDPNDMDMIDSLRKHAKAYGFKEISNPVKWAKKNGYDDGIPTVAMFAHPDDKNNETIVHVYTQQDQKELEVSFYAWGGASGNDSIEGWVTDKYWNQYFGDDTLEK
jgi:hypothetical protein